MRRLAIAVVAAWLCACGGNSSGNGTGNVDARFPTNCGTPDPSKPQCSNCIDDDMDGHIDGYDVHCTGPLDNDEGSFKTGIPGDNVDPIKQDCFFDGNSGAGNDGCNIHVCCLIGATTVADCPLGADSYDPMDCPPPIGNNPLAPNCINYCGALTPPGCDCFGCCTLCDPANPTQCYDILTNPNVSPDCNQDNLADPTKCVRCTQQAACGDPDCGGTTCILCPGQDPSTLPAECMGMTQCPADSVSCANGATCPMGTYCSTSQCCVGIVQ